MNRKGFTLAEVLITLSILGVVAAITIPNIIQQYQKRLTITKLQKAYATLEQAAGNIAINTGCVGKTLECSNLLSITNNYEALATKFFELGNIFISRKIKTNNVYFKAMNYDVFPNQGIRAAGTVLVDKNNIGYVVGPTPIFLNPKSTTSDYVQGLIITVYTNPSFNKYHQEEDSVNGAKNIYNDIKEGYNVFQFLIYNNFIVEPNAGCWAGQKRPLSKMSGASIDNSCNKNVNFNCYGTPCAAKIVKDGWKMNY